MRFIQANRRVLNQQANHRPPDSRHDNNRSRLIDAHTSRIFETRKIRIQDK